MDVMHIVDDAKAAGLAEAKAQAAAIVHAAEMGHPARGFGWRMLPRFKTKNGKRYQLHASRGWKCIGRAKK